MEPSMGAHKIGENIYVKGILGTKWNDGPIEGYLICPQRLFRFELVDMNTLELTDRKLFLLRELLVRPTINYEALNQVFKYPEPESVAGQTVKVLDTVPRSEQKYWFVTLRSRFLGRVKIFKLKEGFDPSPRYDLTVLQQAKMFLEASTDQPESGEPGAPARAENMS
jgi:hypothetical protein